MEFTAFAVLRYINPSWQIQEIFFKILERKFPQTGGVLDMQNDRYAKLPLSQSTFKMADKYAQMAVHQWSVQNVGFFGQNFLNLAPFELGQNFYIIALSVIH